MSYTVSAGASILPVYSDDSIERFMFGTPTILLRDITFKKLGNVHKTYSGAPNKTYNKMCWFNYPIYLVRPPISNVHYPWATCAVGFLLEETEKYDTLSDAAK